MGDAIESEMFKKNYAQIFDGDELWKTLKVPQGETFAWEKDSTYIRRAPYFDNMPVEPPPVRDIRGARVLARLGHSGTTEHISPAGSIKAAGPAGKDMQDATMKCADIKS